MFKRLQSPTPPPELPTIHLRLAVSREGLDLYHACYSSVVASQPLVVPPQVVAGYHGTHVPLYAVAYIDRRAFAAPPAVGAASDRA